MRLSFLSALLLSGLFTGAVAAAIPVDHFDNLTLDAPIENRVRAGDLVRVAGQVDDMSIGVLQVEFETDSGQHIDFFLLVRPDGHFERDLVFLEHQTGSYHMHVFAGSLGEPIPHKGTYSQIVVDGVHEPIQWPAGFFDGIRLDTALPLTWPAGRSLRLQGLILDPVVRQLRFDLDTPAGVRSIALPHINGHFDAFIDFTAADVGSVQLDLVAGDADGNFWGRGTATIDATTSPLPQLQVLALALSIAEGGEAVVPLANAGDGDLILQPATVDGPFSITTSLRGLAAGARGQVGVRFDDSGPATGTLYIHSDDPRRPRVEVALSGITAASEPSIHWQRATGDIPVSPGEQIVALYALPQVDVETVHPFTLGQPPLSLRHEAAGRLMAPSARDQGEALLRRREAVLAARVAARGPVPASRPLAILAELGDQRDFTFDEFSGVAAQRVPATVVALSQHAVAWAHDGSGAGSGQLPAPRIQQMLDQFDADFDLLVRSLGEPSDVDGDGRIHFLYTPLVDSTKFGGFVDAASILPPDVGGNGNHTDLIFIALGEPTASYRSLLAHEFQHLISFNQHVLVRFGDSEVSWLNEGLSHLTEDLVEGHATGGNANRVATYLANPGLVGLIGDASTSAAKRGGAYLFVRSLVDHFGESILLSLIGSGLADVDNLERATGASFEDLLASFAAQLATSGTGLGQHPRFDYSFAALAPDGRRGFGAPEMTRIDATGGVRGQLAGRGLSFFRVHADQARSLALGAAPEAGLAALVLPLPAGFEFPVWIPGDHFRLVDLDQPLPALIHSGDAVRVAGRIDPSVFPPDSRQWEIAFEYQSGGTGDSPSYNLAVEGDRFEGDLVFAHAQSGDYELAVFARYQQGDEFMFDWLGTFQPARVLPGEGIVHLPTRYFDRLQLDAPWPTGMGPDGEATWSGAVLAREGAPDFVRIQADLAGATDTLSVRMDVVDGRFSGQLNLTDQPLGTHTLNLFGQDADGHFTWLGGTDHFEIGHTPITTAVLDGEEITPAAAELGHSYPNPFNSHTVIPFQLDHSRPVAMTIYGLSGQKVAEWNPGTLPAGTHQWRWDTRSEHGDVLASGVYIVQLQTGDLRRTRKLLLLR
ncbi:MAG: T9SS type A sorting domain-containing protein [Gemmatimonadetes bacterium]|nr:T9SS type A sorting domain-containing protein [Gemmatimonadota bacterium]MBT6147025.1 T9SS type A sorting domain-containing protein [Gemmatimonadota bacterium]MBT7863456.1 T9SS type A sorting domain-containing protein [Gemmatimonadota bacterium]